MCVFRLKKIFACVGLLLAFAITLTACKEDSDVLLNNPAGTSDQSTANSTNSTSKSDAEISDTNDSEKSTTDNPEKTDFTSSKDTVGVSENSNTNINPAADESIVSIKTADGSIEYALKEILLRATTFEELNHDLENSEFANRVKGVRAQEHFKGPDVAAGDIKDGMVIFVDYDDDCWVRYVKSQLFDSSKVMIWDGGEFDSALYYIVLRARSIESLNKEVNEFDVNERIDYVRVYKNSSDYENAICITDDKGDLEVGMVIYISYDNETAWMKRVITGFYD